MANLAPAFDTQFFDGQTVAAGYKLYTYESGTTTPKTTYSDQAGSVPNTNPITLDADGRCSLWLGSGEYTFALYTRAIGDGGALVKTWNDVGGAGGAADASSLQTRLANKENSTDGAALVGLFGGGTVASRLDKWVSVYDKGALGLGASSVAQDTAAFIAAADTGKQILVPYGDFWVDSPVTINAGLIGMGCDTGQSSITLTGAGTLIVGDEHATWNGFTLKSADNNKTFITCAVSYWTFHGFRIEKVGAATNQIGIKFVCTSNSVYFADLDCFKFKVDYPVYIEGSGSNVFNANKIGGSLRCYWQDFQSAIYIVGTAAADANCFAGYLESGVNGVNLVSGAFRQNRMHFVLDAVTRAYNGGVSVTDPNVWEIAGGAFTTGGTRPQNQVFVGLETTKVRATDSSGQSVPNATATVVTWNSEQFDTLSEFTNGTGVFQPKYAGTYAVEAVLISAPVAWDVGERWEAQVYKNGTLYQAGDYNPAEAAATVQRSSRVSAIVVMNGTTDYIDIRALHNQGGAVALDTAPAANVINITRVP